MAAGARSPACRSSRRYVPLEVVVEFFHKQTNFPFMATRKMWYALSVALMLISFGSLATRGLNLAIDFTGGVNAEASFTNPVNLDAVRSKLTAAGFHEPQVQNFGSARDISIRMPPDASQNATTIRAKLEPVLKSVDPTATLGDLEVLGPQVGNELRTSAIYALSATLLLIFIYIAFRFH